MANLLKNKKYHFIYKTTNLLNEKYYIGIHSTSNLKDGYLGSGSYLKRAIKKYGKGNFKCEVLEYCNSREELVQREEQIVTVEFIKNSLCMNLKPGGQGHRDSYDHIQVTKKKISDTTKGKNYVERYGEEKARELILLRSVKQKEIWKRRSLKDKAKIFNKVKATSKGKSIEFKTVICPHCSNVGKENIMYRWHFDNCKTVNKVNN